MTDVHVHFASLKDAAELTTLSRALRPIHESVEDLNTWIVKRGVDLDPASLVLDVDDQALDEMLLGTAFVACQAGLVHVASRACRLAKCCHSSGIHALLAWTTKSNVYRVGPALHSSSTSRATFLNAVANYFKHRDEWPDSDWAYLTGRAAKTVADIAAGGLTRGAQDNMRRAVSILGDAIFDELRNWADLVVEEARTELAAHL